MGVRAIVAGLIGLVLGVVVGELITNYIIVSNRETSFRVILTMKIFFDSALGIGLARGLYQGAREAERKQSVKWTDHEQSRYPPKVRDAIPSNPADARHGNEQSESGSIRLDEVGMFVEKQNQAWETKLREYLAKHPEISHEPREVTEAFFVRDVYPTMFRETYGGKINLTLLRKAAEARMKEEGKRRQDWEGATVV